MAARLGVSLIMGEYCEIEEAPLKAPGGGASSLLGAGPRFTWPIVGDGSRIRFIDEEAVGAGRGSDGRPPIIPPAIPAMGPDPSGGDRVEESRDEDAFRELKVGDGLRYPGFGEGPRKLEFGDGPRLGRGGGGRPFGAPGGRIPYGSRSRFWR